MSSPSRGDSEWRSGWPVVFSAAVCVGLPVMGTYTFGVFSPELKKEFGWTSAQLAALFLINPLTYGISSPFVGGAIDRYGARRLALIGMALGALGVAALGVIIGPSYFSYLFAWVLLALLLLPAGMIVWVSGVVRRFDRQRGLALALALCGTNIMGGILAPAARLLIDAFGWRRAYGALGLGFGGIALLVAYLFFRDAPSGGRSRVTREQASGPGLTLRAAMATRQYRLLAPALLLGGGGSVSLFVQLAPIMASHGASPLAAASLTTLAAASAAGGRILTGALLDRVPGPPVAAAMMAGAATGAAMLAFSPVHGIGPIALYGGPVLIGAAVGAELDLVSYLSARYFGLRNFGLIYGTLFAFHLCGQGVGPLLIGWGFDRTGSYQSALSVGALMLAASACLMALLGPYREFDAAVSSPDCDNPARTG